MNGLMEPVALKSEVRNMYSGVLEVEERRIILK
jgi:hypothetical protein